MWNVWVCDDNPTFVRKMKEEIEKFEKRNGLSIVTNCFTDAVEMMERLDETTAIYFLDIEMPKITGLELAQKIMFLNSENIICFVSSHDEIVFKAIHYNPFRFIRKYKIEEEMQEALETLYKKYTDSQKTIVLNSRDGAKSIRLKDLHFVESKNHYVLFHCEQEVIEVRGRLAEYDEELESHYFLRSGVSYLINCDYIKIFHRTKITLQNGKEISIGRKWKDQAQKGYMKYITEKADGRVWCDS